MHVVPPLNPLSTADTIKCSKSNLARHFLANFRTEARCDLKRRATHVPNQIRDGSSLCMRSGNVVSTGRNHNRSQCIPKMESTVLKMCSICSSSTKYRCNTCKILLCNRCAIADREEVKEGWLAGRQVGDSPDCYDEVKGQGPVERRPTEGTAVTTMEKVMQGVEAAQW